MTDHSISLRNQLNSIFSKWSLLESRFYQAWNKGELPIEALSQYSAEYGEFIGLVAEGWDKVHEPTIADIEREHVTLWQKFAHSCGTSVGQAEHPGMKLIASTAKKLFDDHVTALGALYSFEAQQPETAQTKLKGLKEHYSDLDTEGQIYFEVHEHDYDEPALLLEKLEALTVEEQKQAIEACEQMAQALREGLDQLHDSYLNCDC